MKAVLSFIWINMRKEFQTYVRLHCLCALRTDGGVHFHGDAHTVRADQTNSMPEAPYYEQYQLIDPYFPINPH